MRVQYSNAGSPAKSESEFDWLEFDDDGPGVERSCRSPTASSKGCHADSHRRMAAARGTAARGKPLRRRILPALSGSHTELERQPMRAPSKEARQ